jgi:phosphoenolpyruvate carboxykinase (GTP)
MGYNFGKYLEHWCSLKKPGRQMPKIFHVCSFFTYTKISKSGNGFAWWIQVNWFRKSTEGKFLWPGYCENIRVIDWIVKRLEDQPGIGVVRCLIKAGLPRD